MNMRSFAPALTRLTSLFLASPLLACTTTAEADGECDGHGRMVDTSCRCDLGYLGAPDDDGMPTPTPEGCVEMSAEDLDGTAPRRFFTVHGDFRLMAEGEDDVSVDDPRNPGRVLLQTPGSGVSYATTVMSFTEHGSADRFTARDCHYDYTGSLPDPHYFPQGYLSSVWDLFTLLPDEPSACASFHHVALRSPHDQPAHMHMRYGDASREHEALLAMSEDPEAGFDPWWSSYEGVGDDTPRSQPLSFTNFDGTFVMDTTVALTIDDPRNPSLITATMSTEREPAEPLPDTGEVARIAFHDHDDPSVVTGECLYRYAGARPDPFYSVEFRTSVWDVFELVGTQAGDCDDFHHVIVRTPHSDPQHVHLRYGGADQGVERLLELSLAPEQGFDPWWSVYCREGVSGCD